MLYLKSITKNVWLLLAVAAFILCICTRELPAQGTSGELKWIRVGAMQTYFSEQNSEVESGGLDDLNIRVCWPAQYGLRQSTMRGRTMWMGCTNFYDSQVDRTFTAKVIGVGPRFDDNVTNEVLVPPVEFKLVGKYEHPAVTVDGADGTINTLYDAVEEIDENLVADRMMLIKNNTSIGVTITKKVYAFTQQNHNNYFVFDYVLKNTGIVSAAGDVYPQTLTGFIFYLGFRYSFAGESVTGYNQGWGVWNSAWGRNTINDVIGTDPTANDFLYRAHFAWYGPHSERPVSDDWGCPDQLDDGVMAAAKFGGAMVLHADKSAQDHSDDLYQPKTTHFIDTDGDPCYPPPLYTYNEPYCQIRYNTMTLGHAALTQAQQIEASGLYADQWGPGIGGSQSTFGFGPYVLAPGDSIHVVIAQGTAGISREKNREVGGNWLQWTNGTGTPTLTMPTGSTTTDYDGYKEAWVLTCKDSLMKTFANIKSNYDSGYDLPQPPPPPSSFTVTSGGDKILLTWADNASTADYFDGYVIYRSKGTVMSEKTVYEKIFECDASNVVHTFSDFTAVRGFDYYYYIQSKDDGSQNDVTPGTPLYSSMFWTITSMPATLQRPATPPNPYPPDMDSTFFKVTTDRGVWDAGAAYYAYDIVSYNGTSYVVLDSIGVNPALPDTADAIWKPTRDRGPWVSGSSYDAYDVVSYDTFNYVCLFDISEGKGLDLVRVVPNPYDIRSRMFQFGDKSQYDRIAFYNLPPVCKLRIFTERGDMIWQKDHTLGTGDELWDSTTSSGQIVASGIYILYVEAPGQGSIFRKFVIIR
jgi:hypothetical protein